MLSTREDPTIYNSRNLKNCLDQNFEYYQNDLIYNSRNLKSCLDPEGVVFEYN